MLLLLHLNTHNLLDILNNPSSRTFQHMADMCLENKLLAETLLLGNNAPWGIERLGKTDREDSSSLRRR